MSLEQQLAQSSEVKGLGVAELGGKGFDYARAEPSGFLECGFAEYDTCAYSLLIRDNN